MAALLIDTATGTGAGGAVSAKHVSGGTMQVTVVGTFTGLTVALEGTLDAVDAIDAGTATWVALGSTTSTTGGLVHVVDKPVEYVRANVSAFAGGTSVSVRWHGVDVSTS